ncbi:MAG: carbohydrate porin [Akkermansia sp.]|nr:carbohydrate porin [Akkermansia sp.]MBR2313759.1 carbohydrate porin [Akkermansia sp.]
MKFKNILLSLLALSGLCSSPVTAETCDSFHRFYDGALLIPGDDAPAYKQKLFDKTGTAFTVEIFGGYWGIDNQSPNYSSTNYLLLYFSSLDQRIIKDDVNGGTWFNLALAGSWGLDHDSASQNFFYDAGMGIGTGQHTDSVGPAGFYLMNATLRQYFNNKRTCLNVGAIWMSMYFDRISHARFANDAFEKSPVLPMYYGTPGAVLQHEIDQNNFVTAAFIGTGLGLGDNPLNWDNTNGYAVVGEYGHVFAEGKGTWRLASFFCDMDTEGKDGREHQRLSTGIMTGVEYDVNDSVKVYARLAIASSEHQRARKEAMLGTTLRVIPSRPQDYFGACVGVYKCADTGTKDLVNEYEKVIELTYRYHVNDYISLAPFYQLYIDPAYRDTSTVSATGVQAHLAF